MMLSNFPRLRLAHLPTPIERLDRLSEYLGGPEIWIKRDDCTGLAGGGNKTRKLEFLMADARESQADIVLTQGAVQSNHVRQTAAACAKLGIACSVLLEHRIEDPQPAYLENGNVLLDRLFGAEIDYRPSGLDMNGELEALADKLRSQGRRPYVIPGGGSNSTGALGYVNAALEIVAQSTKEGHRFDRLIHATGSAGTQAGLVAGLAAMNAGLPVLGIGVRAPREKQEHMVYSLAVQTYEKITGKTQLGREHVVADCGYVGAGYGLPGPDTIEAIDLLAKLEAILLDPVYSAKGMAGLIDLVRKGEIGREEKVLFLHTGGATALHGYPHVYDETQP